MSRLLEVLPQWLISHILQILDQGGNFLALGENGADLLAGGLKLLLNIIQLSKKEVIELEDYVDASIGHVVDIVVSLVVRPVRYPFLPLFRLCSGQLQAASPSTLPL